MVVPHALQSHAQPPYVSCLAPNAPKPAAFLTLGDEEEGCLHIHTLSGLSFITHQQVQV